MCASDAYGDRMLTVTAVCRVCVNTKNSREVEGKQEQNCTSSATHHGTETVTAIAKSAEETQVAH